jgi:hypothetical protein
MTHQNLTPGKIGLVLGIQASFKCSEGDVGGRTKIARSAFWLYKSSTSVLFSKVKSHANINL